jgi:hypothetical protein
MRVCILTQMKGPPAHEEGLLVSVSVPYPVHCERRGEGRNGDVKDREKRGEEGGESEIECVVRTHVDQCVRMVMRTQEKIFREQTQSFLRTVIYAFPELPSFLPLCSLLYCIVAAVLRSPG